MIDTAFDVRTDTGGKDPDSHSPTLRRYHQLLWSNPLPDGTPFMLDISGPPPYLHHNSSRGEFWLSSDSVMQTFLRHKNMDAITSQVRPAENETFFSLTYTIGGMMVYPATKVDNKMTINGARGFTQTIADRIDLTHECVRRYYLDEWSPLAEVFDRYADFFSLFEDFRGYTDFFLLQDLVTPDYEAVAFFSPFENFERSGRPTRDLATYDEFRERSIAFIHARNRRIEQYCSDLAQGSHE